MRTAVLWVGCTLCVLIVVAFVVSGWWKATVRIPGLGPVSVERGGFFVWVDFDARDEGPYELLSCNPRCILVFYSPYQLENLT